MGVFLNTKKEREKKMEKLVNVFVDVSPIVKIVALAIMGDTVFGVLRSLKEHGFNSSFGIDGGIRKVGMIVAMILLYVADLVIHINLVVFLPKEWLEAINLTKVGMTEFFGILFIAYEIISILKNMILIGLPIPTKLKEKIENFLYTMTDEMPSDEREEN